MGSTTISNRMEIGTMHVLKPLIESPLMWTLKPPLMLMLSFTPALDRDTNQASPESVQDHDNNQASLESCQTSHF